MRPKDTSKPLPSQSVVQILRDPNFQDYTFNDRVMQVLLEHGYIQRQFPKTSESGGENLEYARLMSSLLVSDASVNLKASICRQIISTEQKPEHMHILTTGLVDTCRRGGVFLATYASAGLVNLSYTTDAVKS